jgi:AcrR family transcriptional regulator
MAASTPLDRPPLRADAARNRGALIEAARAVFGQRGLDAPLDDIARHANLGNATLYRHFPARCELVAAVFADTLTDVVAAAQRALRHTDPWAGFTEYVMFLCELQATDRGLADLLTTSISGARDLERLRTAAYRDFALLVDRAKTSGALRTDFEPGDLVLLLMANAGLIHRTAASAPRAWRRLVGLTLDGLRAASATATPPALSAAAVRRAMSDQATQFGCG